MSKKSLLIVLTLIVAVGGGVFIWRAAEARAKDARLESEILKKLTADEINLILRSQTEAGTAISETPEARRVFLEGMREYLALAAAARREGLAEDADFKINFAYKKNLLLADLYKRELTEKQGNNFVVPQTELDAVWDDAANGKQFEADMNALQRIQAAVARERGERYSPGRLQGESLTKARDTWARAKILSDLAQTDAEFMARPEINLRIKILEAGILSADYLRKNWAQNIRATNQEIADYLAAHPEYDLNAKRARAEEILRRARAGESFDLLAKESSEDRQTKDAGGRRADIEPGTLWAEVEQAALALRENQIADRLIETETGWHIVKLEDKKINRDGTFKYGIRHILLQKNFPEPGVDPNVPAPFVKAEEIAKSAIEKAKRDAFVERIERLNEISVPDDFTVARSND